MQERRSLTTPPLSAFCKQGFAGLHVGCLDVAMVFSAPRRRKARLYSADQPLAVEEERGWPRVQVLDLGQFLVEISGNAGDEKGVVKFVALNKGVQASQVCDLLRLFEIKGH